MPVLRAQQRRSGGKWWREESDARLDAGNLVPAGRASPSAARAHALAATYFRPSAVPSVHAIASAADTHAAPAYNH